MGRKGKVRPSLETMARQNLWMTPMAGDGRKGGANQKFGRGNPTLSGQAGGRLNPTWVEWLMGYPTEWTVCEPWAMPSCQLARAKRSSGSAASTTAIAAPKK
jgi:hypothetical protein